MRRVLLPLAAVAAGAGLVVAALLSESLVAFGAGMAGCPDVGRESCEDRQALAYQLNRGVAVVAALGGCAALGWRHQTVRRRAWLVAIAAGVMVVPFVLAMVAIEP